MIQLQKFSCNPILEPDKNSQWDSGAVFNCGAIEVEEEVYLLYRAIPAKYKKTPGGLTGEYISYIGLATSKDGINFTKASKPVMYPDQDFDRFGCEDARVVYFEEEKLYLITYTAISQSLTQKPNFQECVRLALASTKDFKNYTKYGIIGPPCPDKDAVIFPQRIQGKIAMLHRIEPNIQIAYFDDFKQLTNPPADYWEKHIEQLEQYTILKPRFSWEKRKLGAGPTPIKTEHGWLLFYHGVDENFFYRAGAALLDLENPEKVIARTPEPIMEPTEKFETNGDVPNVVFPQGTVSRNGKLFVYYGGGDSCCCGASIEMSRLLEYLLEQRS